MKQKMEINVTMQNEKMKSKAMQIVVAEQGVISVTIEKENDKMVVTGEDFDAARLIMALRKKFCNVEIASVEEVKPPPPPSPPEPTPPLPPLCPLPWPQCLPSPCPPCPPYNYCPSPCQSYYECQVNDPNPPNCSIM